jgi:hypothetical protein
MNLSRFSVFFIKCVNYWLNAIRLRCWARENTFKNDTKISSCNSFSNIYNNLNKEPNKKNSFNMWFEFCSLKKLAYYRRVGAGAAFNSYLEPELEPHKKWNGSATLLLKYADWHLKRDFFLFIERAAMFKTPCVRSVLLTDRVITRFRVWEQMCWNSCLVLLTN